MGRPKGSKNKKLAGAQEPVVESKEVKFNTTINSDVTEEEVSPVENLGFEEVIEEAVKEPDHTPAKKIKKDAIFNLVNLCWDACLNDKGRESVILSSGTKSTNSKEQENAGKKFLATLFEDYVKEVNEGKIY